MIAEEIMYGCERPTLTLSTGRIITLVSHYSCSTYGGLLAGFPSREINASILQSLSREVCRIFRLEGNPSEPSERKAGSRQPFLFDPPRKASSAAGRFPHRQLEDLPGFAHFGLFQSGPTRNAPFSDRSDLVVIWLNDDAFLSAKMLEDLCDVPWEEFAWGFYADDM